MDLFQDTPIWPLPVVERVADARIPTNIWDIPYTIGEMSYLTHSDYRYYGKFPPAVAAQILESHAPSNPNSYVLDNFCGSGTTLVEAKLRGIPSLGLDISWISALASNVKVRHLDLNAVSKLHASFRKFRTQKHLTKPQDAFSHKWFSARADEQLQILQNWLLMIPKCYERDLLLVGFLAIVRRVSLAFDGEVRPHINKTKKQRDVYDAFDKKISDLISSHLDFQSVTEASIDACCLVFDNASDLASVTSDMDIGLVVSHPPYLNSFNYRPVYSLEFYWGAPFERDYVAADDTNKVANELIAHPASEKIITSYFNHLSRCYKRTFAIQKSGGKLAVVIGDCTRNGTLVPVISRTIECCEKIGYKSIEHNFRTTHYGLGKYAYRHRADYHGDGDKRDAILIFEK